jgi:hypothetical protein
MSPHFNLFSGVLFGFAVVAAIAAGAMPKSRRESLVSALVFGAIGVALLFV